MEKNWLHCDHRICNFGLKSTFYIHISPLIFMLNCMKKTFKLKFDNHQVNLCWPRSVWQVHVSLGLSASVQVPNKTRIGLGDHVPVFCADLYTAQIYITICITYLVLCWCTWPQTQVIHSVAEFAELLAKSSKDKKSDRDPNQGIEDGQHPSYISGGVDVAITYKWAEQNYISVSSRLTERIQISTWWVWLKAFCDTVARISMDMHRC